jgi:hypothetical protein
MPLAMRSALVACSLLLTMACGGAKPKGAVVPLTSEQAKAFDNGVDFVATLEGLEGRWRDDWDHDLQVRVATADLIAAVTVRTLLTQTDPSQRPTYRLVARVDRELVGEEEDRELELSVGEQQLGYLSVRENMERIADKSYVVYLKRDTDTGVSWHLSPASDQVISETESKITQLSRAPKKDSGERVIVHTN